MHVCVPGTGGSSHSPEEAVGFNGATVTGNGGSCEPDENPMQKQSVLLNAQPHSLIPWYCLTQSCTFLRAP